MQQTVDAIGQAAGNAIQGPVHAAIRDLIVPGFERASQAIFHQMNDVFQRGMHECKCSALISHNFIALNKTFLALSSENERGSVKYQNPN